MNNIKKICICGGGALSHVISGWISKSGVNVNILTRHPESWEKNIKILTPEGAFDSVLGKISSDAQDVIPEADVILVTVPGYANEQVLKQISPYIKKDARVGGVFCSSGFFFEALKILPQETKLWGFQRVPFISRVENYGHSAYLLGYRPEFKIATERMNELESEEFREWIEEKFGSKTTLMKNYYEVSITNSNPILHTARLYTMFKEWGENDWSDRNILFYEEWTSEASSLLIEMDKELFRLLKYLPVSDSYLIPLLEYYESHDAESLTEKIRSISGLKGILSPMKKIKDGWVPDYTNRYFTEDFGYSLRYIWELAKKYNVDTPNIDRVYEWGEGKIEYIIPTPL